MDAWFKMILSIFLGGLFSGHGTSHQASSGHSSTFGQEGGGSIGPEETAADRPKQNGSQMFHGFEKTEGIFFGKKYGYIYIYN